MGDLQDGESVEMKGSAARPYVIKNVGGVYSCSCPAWRNQSLAIERRTCKHIRKLRGDEAEQQRVGDALPARKASAAKKAGPPRLLPGAIRRGRSAVSLVRPGAQAHRGGSRGESEETERFGRRAAGWLGHSAAVPQL